MCLACHGVPSSRRQFLSLAAAGFTATALFRYPSAFAEGTPTNVTADQAIARLKVADEKYVAVVEKHEKFPGSISPMINAIVPAAKAVYGKPGEFIDNAVRESVKRTAVNIATKSAIVSQLIKARKVKVLAARYDLVRPG
jgi:hypothetical protein